MQFGIELVAHLRRDDLDPVLGEHAHQFAQGQFHPLDHTAGGGALFLAGRVEEAGVAEFIDARLADAHELVPEIEGPIDFVFLDADKDWRLIAALAGAAAGTMVAQNSASDSCAYARGDGTYYTAPCPVTRTGY
mgnify:CR=1 FL=1